MSARLLVAVTIAAFLIALAATIPLAVALRWSGAADDGLASEGVTGTIWGGTLRGASFRGLPLGTVVARIAPLAGGVRLTANGPLRGRGVLASARNGLALRDLHLTAPLSILARGLPFEGDLALDGVDAVMSGGRCIDAHGAARLQALRIAGAPLQDLSLVGEASCRDGRLVLPLSGEARGVALRADVSLGEGRYLVETSVRTTDPTVSAALNLAGFSRGLEGFSRRDDGALALR